MLPVLQVRLLGGFQLQYASQTITAISSSRVQALLAFLILQRNTPISRQHLASLFWPDTSEAQARTNLRNLIHQLRQSCTFFDEYIDVGVQTLGWRNDAPFALDVLSFESCLEVKPRTPIQRELLESAVQIYTGDLLPDCYEDWIVPIRERLRRAFLSALEALVVLTEDGREYAAALEYVGRLVAADPLHASANHQLIRLHALLGDRTAAIKAYRAYSRHLAEELGAEPEKEIQELVSRLQHPFKQEAVPQAMAIMVGRKTEWHAMLSVWESALAGQAQMLMISGEAGIGKTRLVEELARWAGLQGTQVVTAYCYPVEGNLPYAPVVSWLRALPPPRLEKVWLAELARLLPEIRENFSGLPKEEPLREAWQRQRLFEALARALLAGKQSRRSNQLRLTEQPQLLILEDIHWCDQDTLEWLHYLLRFAPHAPMLLVATLRSGEVMKEHPLMLLQSTLRAEGKLAELKLQPLSEPETIQLATQIRAQTTGKSLSAEEASEVYREAEGNPLFAIEMVRLGSVQPCPEPPCGDWLAVSERAQPILLRRVGQVSQGTREITCLAATIGREFNLSVLREASRESEEHVLRAIDELLQRQIIREMNPETAVSSETTLPEETYDFTHDLLRQAALEGMSTAHRRLLHRKVAEAYQRLDQVSLHPRDAEIASHYERAGLFQKAVQHYHLAAETAAGMFANANAQSYLRRAIMLIENCGAGKENSDNLEAYADLLEKLGDLLALDGKYSEAQSCYERALALKRPTTNIWQSQIYRKISDVRIPQYKHALAHAALDEAGQALCFSDEASSLEERQEWLQVQLARIQLYYWEGRPKEMEGIIQQIEPNIYSIGRTDQQITLLSLQYMARQRRERYRLSAETVAIGRRRLELTERNSDPYELAIAQFQYGFGLLWYGDLTLAKEWLSRSLGAIERVGARIWQVRNLAYLSIANRKLENLDEVRKETQQLLELSRAIGDSTYYGIGLANLGWLAWRLGDPVKAACSCNEAHQAWSKSGSNVFRSLADWVLLSIAVGQHNVQQATGCARALLDTNPFYQSAPEPASSLLDQALSAFQRQDEEYAFICLARTLEAARAAHEL